MDSGGSRTRRGWLCALATAAGSLAGCTAPRGGDSPASTDSSGDGTQSSTSSARTSGSATATSDESASSWPTFRGDDRNTGCAVPERGPLDYPREKWSVSTGGGVWSSPVVANGGLYVGSMDRKLYAIDLATGDVDWTYETGGPVQSTPTVAGGRVYFGSFDKHVYCLDAATGDEEWSYETAGLINSSPTVDGTAVYVGSGTIGVAEVHEFIESSGLEQSGGGLYALDRETGDLVWRQYPGHFVSSTPAVADSAVYFGLTDVGDARPLIASLGASDGGVRWEHDVDRGVVASPSVRSGTVYCAGYSGAVYALSAETGDEEWTYHVGRGDIRGSTAVCEGSVYVPTSGNAPARSSDNPVLYSLSLDGEEQWAHEIAGGRQMGSSPAVTSDAVYVGTHHRTDVGGMYAVSHDGERLWGTQVPEGEGVGSSPAVVDGTLYYGADNGTVYAVA